MKKTNNFRIEHLQENDLDYVIHMCDDIFRGLDTMASDPPKVAFFTQISVSYKALLDEEIIGCYLLNEDKIYKRDNFILYEDISPYYEKKSIHGVVLALRPEYHGRGFGKQLRDMPRTIGNYDYIWGFHVKSLNNIDNWTRYGRRVVGENEDNYMTLMDLKLNAN